LSTIYYLEIHSSSVRSHILSKRRNRLNDDTFESFCFWKFV